MLSQAQTSTTQSAPAQDIISLLTPPAHHELRRLSCSDTSYEQEEGENDECEFEDSDGKCYAADLSGTCENRSLNCVQNACS